MRVSSILTFNCCSLIVFLWILKNLKFFCANFFNFQFKKFGLICSSVSTFIGYEQTNKKINKVCIVYRFMMKSLIISNLLSIIFSRGISLIFKQIVYRTDSNYSPPFLFTSQYRKNQGKSLIFLGL